MTEKHINERVDKISSVFCLPVGSSPIKNTHLKDTLRKKYSLKNGSVWRRIKMAEENWIGKHGMLFLFILLVVSIVVYGSKDALDSTYLTNIATISSCTLLFFTVSMLAIKKLSNHYSEWMNENVVDPLSKKIEDVVEPVADDICAKIDICAKMSIVLGDDKFFDDKGKIKKEKVSELVQRASDLKIVIEDAEVEYKKKLERKVKK